ncbi:MAG: glycosyltransferase [Prevotella sp.]|nr:glycosyltransferase [Prevotella sp.]
MNNQQIVTVAVITYNSSKYIVETLESIKLQSYSHLKLIVSDDCSSDNTIQIVREWISNNSSRFIRTQVLTTEVNTGVAANINRAFDACDTEWLKIIAGDDLLLKNCIEDYVDYLNTNPNAEVVFSRVLIFWSSWGRKKWKTSWHDYDFFSLSPKEQYDYLINKGNRLPAPSCLYNIKQLRALKIRFDERIPLLEDFPMWIMFARKGVSFHFMDKNTVGYRIHEDSLSIGLFSPRFYKSNLLLYLYYFQDEIKDEADRDKTYNLMADHMLEFYTKTYNTAIKLKTSPEYMIGFFLLYPYYVVKYIFGRIKSCL